MQTNNFLVQMDHQTTPKPPGLLRSSPGDVPVPTEEEEEETPQNGKPGSAWRSRPWHTMAMTWDFLKS